jgi:hypothetical protein
MRAMTLSDFGQGLVEAEADGQTVDVIGNLL